ncbi:LacI family DNA-binding transcriptional regulator [Cerasicoccus fimbriatus]|uniref:LacI family DNA-binding transcriptional regulator n=1 Tax=Cerasicoccus fimbriatus TaxID=3014554 RepID=UPI0022B2D5F6|nr:LacI family DNA-binding transcriptional regulator [Cerasicoccus sp. TK19100]
MSDASPTIRDIAHALKISPATVSLALRNDQRIAKQTRERVISTARQMGYQLNPAIASLMSQVRTQRSITYQETIAWLNFWEDRDTYQKTGVEFQRRMWQGALRQATELGYSLQNFWMHEKGMTHHRINEILQARGIRAIVIPPLPESAGIPNFDWSNFCGICTSYTITEPHFDRVTPNHFHNIQLILNNLRQRGYQRPGLLLPQGYDERTGHRCLAAYYLMQQAMPKKNRIPAHICDPIRIDDAIINWLKKYQPDAVIMMGTHKDIKKASALSADYLARLGIVLMSNASSDAGFCGIDENPDIIGATGVELLALALQRNLSGTPEHPRLIQIDGHWVEGQSAPALVN